MNEWGRATMKEVFKIKGGPQVVRAMKRGEQSGWKPSRRRIAKSEAVGQCAQGDVGGVAC